MPFDTPIDTDEKALKLIEDAQRAAGYAEKRRHLALDVFPNHPVLIHPIPITGKNLLRGDSWGPGSLWQVYDLAAKADGPVRQRIRQIKRGPSHKTGTVPSERVPERDGTVPVLSQQAQMMLALIEGTPEPLTQNPSFEQGDGADAGHWSWWVKWGVGAMRRTGAVAHTGKFSVLCDGMKRGGPVQVLDVTPGTYGLVCFVYIPEGQTSKGDVELSMTLRNADSVNLPSTSTRVVPPAGRWTAIAVAADVPPKIDDDEVKELMPILIVDGFQPDEKIYFDDLMLYRLDD